MYFIVLVPIDSNITASSSPYPSSVEIKAVPLKNFLRGLFFPQLSPENDLHAGRGLHLSGANVAPGRQVPAASL